MTKTDYDFIVVGAGAAGSIVGAELSASGAQVLVIESGGPDDAPTIANASIWFYNVGGPLDYSLPVTPSPRLNNRKFNMALGHVLGGGSSINAMVWTRGMQRDYDGWADKRRKGLGLRGRAANIQEPGGLGGRRQRVARSRRTDSYSSPKRSSSNSTRLSRGCAPDGHPGSGRR